MPTFPPGTPQSVNPAVTPTWIFSPPTGTNAAPAVIRLSNTSRYPVYVGGSQVTQNTGFAIPPGSKTVELVGVTQNLYALSQVVPGSAAGTAGSSAVTAGSTAITLTTAVPAALAAGTVILVGYSTAATASWEAQVVNSTTASSQITFANPLVQDHPASGVIWTATAQYGQVGVAAGVL